MRKPPPERLRTPSGCWKRWSPKEISRLKEMHKDRCKRKVIAAELGRTVGAINQQVKKFEMTKLRKPPSVKLTGKDCREIDNEDAMHREQIAASQNKFVEAMLRAGHGKINRGPDPAKAVRSGPQKRG